MKFGGYGHFVHASIGGGVRIAGGLGIRAGYMLLDADIHERGGSGAGVAPRIAGPAITIFFRH